MESELGACAGEKSRNISHKSTLVRSIPRTIIARVIRTLLLAPLKRCTPSPNHVPSLKNGPSKDPNNNNNVKKTRIPKSRWSRSGEEKWDHKTKMKEGFTGSLAVAIGGLFDFDVRYFTCRNYNERFFVVVFASFGRLRKRSLVRCFFSRKVDVTWVWTCSDKVGTCGDHDSWEHFRDSTWFQQILILVCSYLQEASETLLSDPSSTAFANRHRERRQTLYLIFAVYRHRPKKAPCFPRA